MQALLGTAKGLIVYIFDGQPHQQIHFEGFNVTMVFVDPHTNRWWAGVNHKHWGQKLHYSDDRGTTWEQVRLPVYEGALLPNGNPAKLRQIWCMNTTVHGDEHTLWMGTDPGGLFKSTDQGKSFQLVDSLWNHPSRDIEGQWFGAGSDYPFIHTIVVDPVNPLHLYIAISCAGVFETLDGGESWEARNNGLIAAYLPNPHVEVGHDPHMIRIHPENPQVLWQQNHCGIFHSKNGGKQWVHVSQPNTVPDYGFGLVIDEKDPSRAWVIPVQSDEQRIAPDFTLKVFRTENFGQTWLPDDIGLPNPPVFDIVLRNAFERMGEFMLFGTTNGNVYYRENDKSKWLILNSFLTKVNSVYLCE